MGYPYKIAVLLTCHNRKEKTLACLNSLSESTISGDNQFDIFLVDDGSTDGTREAISDKYPDITIIQGDGNLYWNRGMHLAWEKAIKEDDFDFYLWLNDDTILFKHALKKALKISEKENHKSIVVGATCNINKTITTYGGWSHGKLITTNSIKQYCDFFNGNFVLVPISAFRVLGNLDYRYRHTHGDFDYGYRAKKKGIKSILIPEFIGICERDKNTLMCFDPEVPFSKRLKLFYSPLGKNPFEFFYFNNKHRGTIPALRIFVSNHFRVLFPSLFTK
ncbi:MAG: glycosyltransferase family 2 protein [Mangrovibacterium sp.]